MAEYIYARVSTVEQTTDNQTYHLSAKYPNATLIEENVSGTKVRPALENLIKSLQPGDTLIVAALDRLWRRAGKLIMLLDDLRSRDINLISVREGVDYRTPAGKIVSMLLSVMAEVERDWISARVKESMLAAKRMGRKVGTDPLPDDVEVTILALRKQGYSFKVIGEEVGAHPTTVANVCRGKLNLRMEKYLKEITELAEMEKDGAFDHLRAFGQKRT